MNTHKARSRKPTSGKPAFSKTAANNGALAAPAKARHKPRPKAAPSNLMVTFRHLQPSSALQQYASRKLGRTGKFLARPAEIHLVLDVDKYRQRGEVKIQAAGFYLSAQQEGKSLYEVVDLLADKVERQIKRHSEKLTQRRSRPAPASAQEL